jgi:hypothetical protein
MNTCQKCKHHLVKYPTTQSNVLRGVFPSSIVNGLYEVLCLRCGNKLLLDMFMKKLKEQDMGIMEMVAKGPRLDYVSMWTKDIVRGKKADFIIMDDVVA